MAAGKYLRRQGLPDITRLQADSIQTQIDDEVAVWRKRRTKRRAA